MEAPDFGPGKRAFQARERAGALIHPGFSPGAQDIIYTAFNNSESPAIQGKREARRQWPISHRSGTLRTVKILRYVELKSGHSDASPAWIAYVERSQTGRTLYFNGRGLMKLKGQRRGDSGGNYIDMETGESFWVSGVKKNGKDRHWAGSGKVLVEAAAVAEYLETIKDGALDPSRCKVTNSIRQTDIGSLSRLANSPDKGWPYDPDERTPYSFVRNVTPSDK